MRLSNVIYYALGFSYMLFAAELFYIALRIDDFVAQRGLSAHYIFRPSIFVVIGLTLVGSGVMLLADPEEYTLAKLLAVSGLLLFIGGIGSGLEYAARRHYLGYDDAVIVPVYVSPKISQALGLNVSFFGSLIMLLLSILPAAVFVITEYERLISTSVILLNAALPALATAAIMMVIPGNRVLAGLSASVMFIGFASLAFLDLYRALKTIPAERAE